MSRNRVVGDPLNVVHKTQSFQVDPSVDWYSVAAPPGSPVVVTLDPNAVNGDQYVIQDSGGNALSQNISIQAVAPQVIQGFGAGGTVLIRDNYAAMCAVFSEPDNAWLVTYTKAPVAP